MKKRIFSLLMSIVLCLSLSTAVMALNWDTSSLPPDGEYFFPPESLWQEKISISNIVAQGAFDRQDGSFIAQRVYYCTAPARITLLKSADVDLGGSMQAVSVTEDGTIIYGSQVEPTWRNAIPDPDFGGINGPDTYWDLPEGIYYMWSVQRSQDLFIVVGNPNNAYEVIMNDDQAVYLSEPTFGSIEAGGGDAPPYTLYYVSPDTTITLPEDSENQYEITSFHNIPGQSEHEEVTLPLSPGETITFRDLGGSVTDNYDCLIVEKVNWWTVYCFRVMADKEQFSDVSPDMYYYNPVSWAIQEGITNGTSSTTFSPDQTCSQAHILTFLWRAAGSPEPNGDSVFTHGDVVDSQYFYNAFLWAYEAGIITNPALDPNTPCSRSDVVTYLWKLSGMPVRGSNIFQDIPADAVYADAVAWAIEEGITNGTSATTFGPVDICTRGQIVTFLYRYFTR